MNLSLDWCSFKLADFACKHWHYSKSVPVPPRVMVGVWEKGKYKGCVIFSRGACRNIGKTYGLKQSEICELTRIALTNHDNPVSKIIAISLKMLKKKAPGLKLAVSYADTNQNHHGGIYQASNWIYVGKTAVTFVYVDINGRRWHSRQVTPDGKWKAWMPATKKQFGKFRKCPRESDCVKLRQEGKHKYLMPLNNEMKNKILSLGKQYPKRLSSNVRTSADQAEDGGSNPTQTHKEVAR